MPHRRGEAREASPWPHLTERRAALSSQTPKKPHAPLARSGAPGWGSAPSSPSRAGGGSRGATYHEQSEAVEVGAGGGPATVARNKHAGWGGEERSNEGRAAPRFLGGVGSDGD